MVYCIRRSLEKCCGRIASHGCIAPPYPTTTLSELAQLQSTVSALAEHMNWFMSKLAEDDSEAGTSRNIETDAKSIASTSSTKAPEPEKEFYDSRENVAPNVDGKLANIVRNFCQNKMSEDKLKEKLTSYVRPGNCAALALTRVNPEIWEKLSPISRSNDIKLQRVQNATVQAMVAITHRIRMRFSQKPRWRRPLRLSSTDWR